MFGDKHLKRIDVVVVRRTPESHLLSALANSLSVWRSCAPFVGAVWANQSKKREDVLMDDENFSLLFLLSVLCVVDLNVFVSDVDDHKRLCEAVFLGDDLHVAVRDGLDFGRPQIS